MIRKEKTKLDTGNYERLSFQTFDALTGLDLPDAPKESSDEGARKTADEVCSKNPITTKKGRVLMRKETSQRGGKTVFVVYDFEGAVSNAEISTIGKRLKKACGTGGTVKGREIEIQGQNGEKVAQWLEEEGFRVGGQMR